MYPSPVPSSATTKSEIEYVNVATIVLIGYSAKSSGEVMLIEGAFATEKLTVSVNGVES